MTTLREHLERQLVELWEGPECDPTGAWLERAIEENRAMRAILDAARSVMGVPWMNRAEVSQAIPPAFTSFIGAALMAHLSTTAASAVSQ